MNKLKIMFSQVSKELLDNGFIPDEQFLDDYAFGMDETKLRDKYYMTLDGYESFSLELDRLLNVEDEI